MWRAACRRSAACSRPVLLPSSYKAACNRAGEGREGRLGQAEVKKEARAGRLGNPKKLHLPLYIQIWEGQVHTCRTVPGPSFPFFS